MDESFTVRPIGPAAIPRALAKAERYRLLNEPEQAESICLDILAADPDSQEALVVLILAITDQFSRDGRRVREARDCVARLTDPYHRLYYEGLTWEREGRARLGRPHGASGGAYDCFRRAMSLYEQASTRGADDDDDAVLRWNACVRTIQRSHLGPEPTEREPFIPLLE